VIFRVIFFLALAVGAYLAFRWLIRQPRKSQLQAGAIVLGILLIALAATGRLNWIFALFGAALPFLRRLLPLLGYVPTARQAYQRFKNAGSGGRESSGQQSVVQTRFLKMTLDHDSGEMNGTVLEGRYAGQSLSELAQGQLLELLGECEREDEESARLLRAYLDRVHGEEWAQAGASQARSDQSGFSSTMTRQEAFEILGLEPGAGEAEVREAHRRLMQKLHPDRGGSTFLAAKINQAKDVLLRAS
jgi:hypothetical protein